jgi:FkbM family methyltransferase
MYHKIGVSDVVWIEGNPDLRGPLESAVAPYGHEVLIGLLSEKDGKEVIFNITNFQSMSSSILEFGTHLKVSPEVHWVDHRVLSTTTMDTLLSAHSVDDYNFLNMDLQGAELLALKGATKTLGHIDYIYSEINKDELYRDCVLLDELVEYLKDFELVEYFMEGSADPNHPRWSGWGDGLFIRRGLS